MEQLRADVQRLANQLQEEKQQKVFDAEAEVQRLKDHLAQVEDNVDRLAASQAQKAAMQKPPSLSAQQKPEEPVTDQATDDDAPQLKRQLEEAVQEMKKLQVGVVLRRRSISLELHSSPHMVDFQM